LCERPLPNTISWARKEAQIAHRQAPSGGLPFLIRCRGRSSREKKSTRRVPSKKPASRATDLGAISTMSPAAPLNGWTSSLATVQHVRCVSAHQSWRRGHGAAQLAGAVGDQAAPPRDWTKPPPVEAKGI